MGYVGLREAQGVLLNCLSRLEYRGYDSCGIAVSNGHIAQFKDAVRVGALKETCPIFEGTAGIGHTRWATHGLPTAINAHPHFDCSQRIAVVHNGIISNYDQLRKLLIDEGHLFVSDTDTEVIPHLIEKYLDDEPITAVEVALSKLEGSFAIAVLIDGYDRIIASRKESPLVIGIGDNEKIIASDVPAILDYTNRVIYLEDGDIAIVSNNEVQVKQNHGGGTVNREIHLIDWDRKQIEKGAYDHYLIKEIHEQPKVIRDSLANYFERETYDFQSLIDSETSSLVILGCGTSYHAALVGKHIIEELLGIQVRTELASEFVNRGRVMPASAAIAITQSGETADVLLSLKKMKQSVARIFVITNVPGSSASRMANHTIFTNAGPEVSVAATKSYTAQLIELYKLALSSNLLEHSIRKQMQAELRQLPALVKQVLDSESEIANYSRMLSDCSTVFYVGRGINFPVALEGALKLKEISYIHAEGYAAGELKHGPFAMLDKRTPVIAMIAKDDVYDPMISSIKEIKARSSPVIAVADESDDSIGSLADVTIRVPHTSSIFSPVINGVVLQLIAYYTAKYKGCPIDFPRNLAKSVTVI
ncbi:MAG: glutamine--fructose-6-phosphate transaminase (isomerizing) [Dehalococcoidales bacterium]|nr:glutamine--fructose-6-phosphate transaminase (isomerizing) [Dehalococcoidales bacterium]